MLLRLDEVSDSSCCQASAPAENVLEQILPRRYDVQISLSEFVTNSNIHLAALSLPVIILISALTEMPSEKALRKFDAARQRVKGG